MGEIEGEEWTVGGVEGGRGRGREEGVEGERGGG